MVKKRRKADTLDILRTLRHEHRRFLAIAVITALGVMMFSGLKASCADLRHSADTFFDAQDLHDLRILSTLGLTEEDRRVLAETDGVSKAEGVFRKEVTGRYQDEPFKVGLETIPESLDQPYVLEGELPQKNDEVLITQRMAKDTGLSIGDTFSVREEASEGEDPVFKASSFTVSGIGIDPKDINNSTGAVSYRTSSTEADTAYITSDAVDSDLYTSIILQAEGAEDLYCFGDAYRDQIRLLKDSIETDVAGQREKARDEEIRDQAEEKIRDAQSDAEKELSEAEQKLQDAQKQIEDGKAQLSSAQAELETGKEKAASSFADAQAEIDANRASLENAKTQLDQAGTELKDAVKQIEVDGKTIAEQKDALQTAFAGVQAGESQVSASFEQITHAYTEHGLTFPKEQYEAYRDGVSALYGQAYTDTKDYTEEADLSSLNESETQLRNALPVSAEEVIRLAQQEGKLSAMHAGMNGKIEALVRLETAVSEYETNLASYKEGMRQLEEAQNQLDAKRSEAEAGFVSAQSEIDANADQLEQAENDLEQGKADYEEGKQKADDEIAEARKKLEDLDTASWYVQDRTSLGGYSNVKSDASSIEAIGTVFPIVFLIVAVLISLTAITRMVEEDRGLIGTYKSLGYTDREIRKKYLVYAGMAVLLGAVLGTLLGYIVLPRFIFWVFSVMYLLPHYEYHFLWAEGLGGPLIFAAAILGAAYLASRRDLKETPASLMRPKAPRAGRRTVLERIPFLWRHLSFLNKVTARNLFRYKRRMFMTVFGIAGCMALLLFGFAIRDSVHDLRPRQYEKTFLYDIFAVSTGQDFKGDYASVQKDDRTEETLPFMTSQITLTTDAGEETEQLLIFEDDADLSDWIILHDGKGNIVDLGPGDVIVTGNAADTLQFRAGSTIETKLADLQTAEIKVSALVENYLGNYVYMRKSTYGSYFSDYEQNSFFVDVSEECRDPVGFADEIGKMDGMNTVLSTQKMKETFTQSFQLINAVVAIVIVMSAALAFVVLFTLSTTNISERVREIATIKVLGFYDPEVHAYIDKETLILTGIGILLGVPLGRVFAGTLTSVLKLPSIYLAVSLHVSSYLFAAGLCVVFALAVLFVTDRTLDRIDPVTALKSVE